MVALAQNWLATDPISALANYTWVNNVTIGSTYCRFAYDGDRHCLTHYQGLPFTAIAVQGEDPCTIRQLAKTLLDPGQLAYSLVPGPIRTGMHQAVIVEQERMEWQMLLAGDCGQVSHTDTRQLSYDDLPHMLALAATDEVLAFGPDTFARNPYFGAFSGKRLVAMGGIQSQIPGMCEIGSIITHPQFRRRGYARQVVGNLVDFIQNVGKTPFLCLFQTNRPAQALYESLGFSIINELALLRWHLSD